MNNSFYSPWLHFGRGVHYPLNAILLRCILVCDFYLWIINLRAQVRRDPVFADLAPQIS